MKFSLCGNKSVFCSSRHKWFILFLEIGKSLEFFSYSSLFLSIFWFVLWHSPQFLDLSNSIKIQQFQVWLQKGKKKICFNCSAILTSSCACNQLMLYSSARYWSFWPFSFWRRKYLHLPCISFHIITIWFNCIILLDYTALHVCIFSVASLNHPWPRSVRSLVKIFDLNWAGSHMNVCLCFIYS